MRVAAPLFVVAIVATPNPTMAQCLVKPRILVLVDSSASMTLHMTDGNPSGGDGSILYADALMTRGLATTPGFALYPGYRVSGSSCPNTSTSLTAYDGVNGRLYAVKATLSDTIAAAGNVDWGLERYAGTTCPVVNTTTALGIGCSDDSTCPAGGFCISGQCRANNNLCVFTNAYDVACNAEGETTLTYGGTCGTSVPAGNAACATQQVCYANADCATGFAGQCALLAGGPARSCTCAGPSDCPAGYACSSGRCVYNVGCQNPGGTILIDPAVSGANAQIPPFLDGIELLAGAPGGPNPELRADGGAPLAGAARTATAWYNNIKTGNLDPQIFCRPYVLVIITGAIDSCDADTAKGPVAAAGSFVAATVPGARSINKVHVIGAGFGPGPVPALDAIAKVGGTGTARLASSPADIRAALADVVRSSILVEKCNNADDDCNFQCDESFPNVAVTSPTCSNPRAATACTNLALPGTHCFATGVVACSSDQLSQRCSAPTCATNPALCPTPETGGGCNGVDDDCNGVVDDCTSFVANSCCPG